MTFAQKQKENTLEKAQARVFLRAGNKQYEAKITAKRKHSIKRL